MDVGKALLHDAKKGGLYLLGQPAKLARHFEIDLDSASLDEPFNVPI